MVLSSQCWLLCCVLYVEIMISWCITMYYQYNIQCSQSVRIRRIFLMSDAAPCILSAISTSLGSSLSPPFFSCHGDDVKLHHRFSPVDGLRGGATNPGQSTAGTIILTSCLWISVLPSPTRRTVVSSCLKCAKLCIYKPVSAETRSEPRYFSHLFLFSLFGFAFGWVFCRFSCFDGAGSSRLIHPARIL